jgi:hypothetical protein
MLTIAKESIKRFKSSVKRITGRNRGKSLEEIIKELNQKIPGWIRYFKLARAKSVINTLDSWIRRKLRCYKLKQMKRVCTVAKTLISMGVMEWQAWIFALSGKGYWRMSGAPQIHTAMNNKWFNGQGLINLEKLYLSL